jgi:hypothetical protein
MSGRPDRLIEDCVDDDLVEAVAEHLYRNDGKHLAITSGDEVWFVPFCDLAPSRRADYLGEARGLLAWIVPLVRRAA